MSEESRTQPSLLEASALAESDIGTFEWDREQYADLLTVSADGRTVEWGPRKPEYTAKYYPVWVPAPTRLRLHSGRFQWTFEVEEMAEAQIGVGFLLLWDVGPDWGFYGYLGASSTAWSYDPSTGDVVRSTRSIQSGLPTFANRRSGEVSVRLHLPRNAEGSASFLVDGVETQRFPLPTGAVILPAACFLKESQRVSLSRFERSPL